MKRPFVSVVIPFYNTNRGVLNRAVQSVIAQTYDNKEIIVIDDCSPLEASDDLSDINFPKLYVFRNESNKHGACSRNIGMAKARGQYIALLDADDYWDDEHLEKCVKGIENYDFIYSNFIRVRNNKKELVLVSDINNYSKKNVCDFLFDRPSITNSFFFKASCFLSVKFNERLKRHQDYQFFIDFYLAGFKMENWIFARLIIFIVIIKGR